MDRFVKSNVLSLTLEGKGTQFLKSNVKWRPLKSLLIFKREISVSVILKNVIYN